MPDFKLYCKAVIIKIVWYWHRNRHIDQWYRIENPEMDCQFYGQLIFDKAGKNIQWKRLSLQQMVLGTLDSHMQKNETGPFSYTIHKIDSKWMKDLNVRQESIKILEENICSNLFDLSCSNFLLEMSPKARETRAKMNYWVFIKLKNVCK